MRQKEKEQMEEIGDEYAFVKAARDGNKEEVNRFLASGVDVNVCLEDSEQNTKTALYVACKHGRTEIVDKLLTLGADWKICRKGVSPLLIAAKKGNLAIVQKLLNAGAALTQSYDDLRRTALHYAAWGGREREKEGKVESERESEKESLRVVKWLVEEKGAKENEKDALGLTPMCYAAESDNLEVLKFLEETEKKRGGGEVKEEKKRNEKEEEEEGEKKSPSLLSFAVQGEAVRVIRYLSEKGVKLDNKDILHNAARYHPKIVAELVNVGLVDKENANERDEDGNTPLHLIFSETQFSEEMLAAVRALVRAGAEINAKDELDKTVISKWVCGTMGDKEMLEKGVKELLKIGANVNEGGVLHMCLEAKEMEILFLLLRTYGADINARYEGETVLHMAAREGEGEEVERLVKEGAELDAKDEDGHTPAYLAAKGGKKEVYNKLVKLGARPVPEFDVQN